MSPSPWFWFIAGLILAGLEIVAPGIYLLWMGLGAIIVGLVLALMPDLATSWQLVLFALLMLCSISLGFLVQRRGSARPDQHLNQELQGLIGKHFVSATDFRAGEGRIHVADTTYGALSEDDIKAGEVVKAVGLVEGKIKVILEHPH